MNIRNKNWIVSLALLLSFSLVFPFCCHADISELFSHHQDSSIHAEQTPHQDASDCSCGHELRKDFQKNKKVAAGQQILLPLVKLPTEDAITLHPDQSVLPFSVVQPGILADAAPPLHVLNSVFLN